VPCPPIFASLCRGSMLNALTIDVEDYFHVTAFEHCMSPAEWDCCESRVADNTLHILDLLDESNVRATFFVLGWVAERNPSLVKEIARRGHEIASHGYSHRRVYNLTQKQFRDDICTSKALLEQLIGDSVLGYRAPSYSISKKCLWAYDELLDAGYQYDSSVFPVKHDLYGIPDWPHYSFIVSKSADGKWRPLPSDDSLLSHASFPRMREIPITTLSLMGNNIPIAGGGYFRLFPYAFTRWGLNSINCRDNRPFVFYLHPWELDPAQPRIKKAGLKSSLRHYLNLHKTEGRFRKILREFEFSTVRSAFMLDA